MKEQQYLVLAREIKKNENGIFSFIDICQHLAVNELPARGKFDLAIICGPCWQPGNYRLHIATKLDQDDPIKVGYADVQIIDDNHIYTAVFHNLGIIIDKDKAFSFLVYKESGELEDIESTKSKLIGDLIIERPFVVHIFKDSSKEQTESSN